jgi:hypothetical protein
MQVTKIVYWQGKQFWLGYLQDYPDYWTQGENLDDLKEHLGNSIRTLPAAKLPASARLKTW